MQDIPRSRLSIDLPLDLHIELNKLLGGWRIKRPLYEKITRDLVTILHKLTAPQRRQFLVGILDDFVAIEDYSTNIQEVLNEGENED